MYRGRITELQEKALEEIIDLNKKVITNTELFKIWDKYLAGYIDMGKFKELIREKGIEVLDK